MAQAYIVDRLEQDLGVPVVHPQTAHVWETQKRLQINEPRQGFGTLISKLPPLRDAIRKPVGLLRAKIPCRRPTWKHTAPAE